MKFITTQAVMAGTGTVQRSLSSHRVGSRTQEGSGVYTGNTHTKLPNWPDTPPPPPAQQLAATEKMTLSISSEKDVVQLSSV